MAKTYPVKFFSSSMQGAPSVSADDSAGQVAQLLKACLVDGFGALAPDLLTWDADLGLAKAAFSLGHNYEIDSIIKCGGASPTEYNGEHRIIKVSTYEIWFELDEDATVPASGENIEIKVAPAGWTLDHVDGANEIMIFTPTEDLGNVSLRIDNSAYSGWSGGNRYGRHCKVAMVEDVVDINTYTTVYEHCWAATDYFSSGGWDLVADNRIFYYMMKYGYGQEFAGFVAGYIDSIRAGDRYHFIMNHLATMNAETNDSNWGYTGTSYNYYTYFARNGSTSQNRIARKYHQLEGSDTWMKRGMGSYGSDLMPLPNPSDNGFHINVQPQIVQESNGTFRGYMPILIEPLANNTALYRKNLQNLPEHSGKIFRFLLSTWDRCSDYSDTLIGFDISTVEV